MAIIIVSTEESDIKTLTKLSDICFRSAHSVLFDGPLRTETLDALAEQCFGPYFKKNENNESQITPPKRWVALKAIDDETGEIVGESRWVIHYENEALTKTVEERVEELHTPPLPQTRVEVNRAWVRMVAEAKRQALKFQEAGSSRIDIRESDPNKITALHKRVYLQALLVHPEHQRKGIGRKLLQWGLDEADKLGLITSLESTPEGRRLYEKAGFEVVKELSLDLTPYGQTGKLPLAIMVRQPNPKN
ncbi:acyl-CoA N-acyltransferase [Talaromyces proteolyticus]|uniref:Acyl-CoA N-acyltransferase n=1 Tax=Talaromyces proteolyticus TaxID=1131652 RepID=A0AAD4KJI3_9EURO|nr:acyl-CoA N-acyltransferase [Talaromyces proteolyticus]KAH8690707.1 acyl-CoA N-acyltransferase [Talaromyces proteolyticus]